MEQSRNDFQRQTLAHFDQAVENSLKDLDEGRLDAVKTESLRESAEQTIVQEALRQSEEELIERQMLEAQGIRVTNTQAQLSIEEQQLQKAMAESLGQTVRVHSVSVNLSFNEDSSPILSDFSLTCFTLCCLGCLCLSVFLIFVPG